VRAYKFRLNSSESSIYYRFYVFIFYKFGKISLGLFEQFICLVLRFIASIFLLVFSPNIIRLLLGWDGLGVTSYLLVIFYQSNKSYNADINYRTNKPFRRCLAPHFYFNYIGLRKLKVFIFTRRSFRFSLLLLTIIIISACTKSVQIPFLAWLPAAMAAPTPISALVHSSMLVTAGVCLLIRINILLINGIGISNILMVIGTFTISMAGCAAMLEDRYKKGYCLVNFKSIRNYDNSYWGRSPNISLFSFTFTCFF